MQCPKCGAGLELEAGYCPQCGAKYEVRRVRRPGKKCPACGVVVPAGAAVCSGCGYAFSAAAPAARCATCGGVLAPGAVFCGSCGARVVTPSDAGAECAHAGRTERADRGLWITLLILLAVLVVGSAGFLIWYFLI